MSCPGGGQTRENFKTMLSWRKFCAGSNEPTLNPHGLFVSELCAKRQFLTFNWPWMTFDLILVFIKSCSLTTSMLSQNMKPVRHSLIELFKFGVLGVFAPSCPILYFWSTKNNRAHQHTKAQLYPRFQEHQPLWHWVRECQPTLNTHTHTYTHTHTHIRQVERIGCFFCLRQNKKPIKKVPLIHLNVVPKYEAGVNSYIELLQLQILRVNN